MKTILLTLALAYGSDAASTCANLRAGLNEANPFLPRSCPAIVAVHAVSVPVETWLLSKLQPSHPTLVRNFVIGIVGSRGVLVGWNLRAHVDVRRP